jgi:tetratricopeptide (TPR) repeat protein
MGVHLDRALVLFGQTRFDDAEKELRQELAHEPECPMTHAFLAMCLSKREDYRQATEMARRAVSYGPDMPFSHYALAGVLSDRERFEEAEEAIDEAIRIDPEDADYRALRANIRYNQKRWRDALAAAAEGLAIDAEHVECNNLRAMALVKLGRNAEAGATIESALAHEPENPFTHANQGWALLHQGDHKKALEHFREALRLDPELDFARAGIVEALKARNILYRLMLRYFLWMSRFSGKVQWAIILGGYIGYRVILSLGETYPAVRPYAGPVQIAYISFALFTWIADPLFNLLLRLDRFGRYALSRDQIVASNWVGLCLLGTLGAVIAWLVTGDDHLGLSALSWGLLLVPVAGTFKCAQGWPRWVMGGYSVCLALTASAGLGLLIAGLNMRKGDPADLARVAGLGFVVLTLAGDFLGGLLGNGLILVRPRR